MADVSLEPDSKEVDRCSPCAWCRPRSETA